MPKLLDLFCGAGGAAMGYHRAGFDEIVGIDLVPQPNYPFTFVQADALQPPIDIDAFDLIHASPPCQGYTPMANRWGSTAERLIDDTLELIGGRPYVLENVAGAGVDGIQLCGSQFGLPVWRHRRFQSSHLLMAPPRCRHIGEAVAVYGRPDGRRLYDRSDGSILRAWASVAEGRAALGIEWTDDWHEIREAIPPAYTQYIGEAFLEQHRVA